MKSISFVIPVYNEEKRFKKTFKAFNELSVPRGLKLKEIIFVNDGSSDRTESCIKYYVACRKKKSIIHNTKYKIHVLGYKQNKGKGYAIRLGMKHSTADYTLFFDADISTPLSEIKKIFPLMEKNIDAIIGTRKNGKSTVIKKQPFLRESLGKCFTKITQIILKTKITDFTCGFKAFSRKAKEEIIQKSKINRWSFDSEFIFILENAKFSVREVPVVWTNDERTKVNLFKDIPQSFFDLLRIVWIHKIEPLKAGFNLKSLALSVKINK